MSQKIKPELEITNEPKNHFYHYLKLRGQIDIWELSEATGFQRGASSSSFWQPNTYLLSTPFPNQPYFPAFWSTHHRS